MGYTELQKRGVSGCNLLEIAGTQTGEHMQRVGGGREGAKQHEKPPGGEEEGIHISIFTLAQAATDAVEGWSSFSWWRRELAEPVLQSHLLHAARAGQRRRNRLCTAVLHPEAAVASPEKAILRTNPAPQILLGQQPLINIIPVPALPSPGLFANFSLL